MAVLVVAVTAGCSPGNTEGGGSRPEFYWVIANNSDEMIAIVTQQPDRATGVVGAADPEQPEGTFEITIPAGETYKLPEGFAVAGDTAPGGCFNGQDRWIVRSRSGQPGFPPRTPIDEYLDDLEVLTYVDGNTCTDQEELVWEYVGVGAPSV